METSCSDPLHFLATHSVEVFFVVQKGKFSIVVDLDSFFSFNFFLFLNYNLKKYYFN
jgi:hypothetical protein